MKLATFLTGCQTSRIQKEDFFRAEKAVSAAPTLEELRRRQRKESLGAMASPPTNGVKVDKEDNGEKLPHNFTWAESVCTKDPFNEGGRH